MSSDADPGAVRAIVAGHGAFAEGAISAVEQITGRGGQFVGVSNRDVCASDLEAMLRARVEADGVRVIFTDLPAGSATMAARRLQRSHPEVVVVTGTSVAALLEFAFAEGDAIEAAQRAAEKARQALGVQGAPSMPGVPRAD